MCVSPTCDPEGAIKEGVASTVVGKVVDVRIK